MIGNIINLKIQLLTWKKEFVKENHFELGNITTVSAEKEPNYVGNITRDLIEFLYQ